MFNEKLWFFCGLFFSQNQSDFLFASPGLEISSGPCNSARTQSGTSLLYTSLPPARHLYLHPPHTLLVHEHLCAFLNMLALLVAVAVMVGPGMTADLNRQAIIFNEKTPGVFYCPQVCHDDRQTDRHAWEDGFQWRHSIPLYLEVTVQLHQWHKWVKNTMSFT